MTQEHDLPLPPENEGGFFPGSAPEAAAPAAPYRVLARKYRPQNFDDLIGQETLVRVLRRAFETGRVAHAFMLTGVRGVGKTTAARIIARALNCVGPDGKGGPTADPCGVCPNCRAILADRHPDVLEMDAASRTGVDDVREIIEATRFRPMQGRMKVFVIDEVHMLSRNAFNALLKTLEEPPDQVTFIFATTELRKVPVTVLSRCQRFDLRRVPQDMLIEHFGRIAQKEGVAFPPEALALIARAADGSVRDGLSLLDQAIAQGATEEGASGAASVAAMLGLADRGMIYDLLEAIMDGRVGTALTITDQAYASGAELGVVLADLLELLHLLSRLKAIPSLREGHALSEMERVRGGALADRLSPTVLGRSWQILLKGVQEVELAPNRRQAAEMVLIRLCHASLLPTPDQLIRQLTPSRTESGPQAQSGGKPVPTEAGNRPSSVVSVAAASSAPRGDGPVSYMKLVANGGEVVSAQAEIEARPEPALVETALAEPDPVQAPPRPPLPRTWREMVALVGQEQEAWLHGVLRHFAHPVQFSPPEVALRIDDPEVRHKALRLLRETLERLHPGQWRVAASEAAGEPTLDEQGAEIIALNRAHAVEHPLVQAIMDMFPGAQLGTVRDRTLDHYGLPPENPTQLGEDDPPDLDFAPFDADSLDESDLD